MSTAKRRDKQIHAPWLLVVVALAACGGDDSARHPPDGPLGSDSAEAFELAALPSGSFAYTQGSYIESFQFKAPAASHVTQLGYFDSNLAGTAQTFVATQVGLYDLTTHTLLGSTTVGPSDAASGIFRFHALDSSIALNTVDTYAAVAVTGTDHYVSNYTYGGELASQLTWVGFAGYGDNNLTMTTTLVEPDYFPTGGVGNIGPDFVFQAD